jgi:hypothetical protein
MPELVSGDNMAKPNSGTWRRFRPAANRAIATGGEQFLTAIKLEAMNAFLVPKIKSGTPILGGSCDEIVRRRVCPPSIHLLAEGQFGFVVGDILFGSLRRSSSELVESHGAVAAHQAQAPFFRIKRKVVHRKAEVMIE